MGKRKSDRGRDFSSAKERLLSLLAEATPKILRDIPQDPASQNYIQTVLSVTDKKFAPNWSLLLLWVSLTNATPITFWTLALIYGHPKVLAKIQAEMADVLKPGETIKQCVMEAIRLHSPGVLTRLVVKDFTAQGYTIPAGDLLMVSPYWTHRDPHFYTEPDVFRPEGYLNNNFLQTDWLIAVFFFVSYLNKGFVLERWDGQEDNSFPVEFIAFGGGRYQCPGRWLAISEIHLYVSMFISMFDCKLLKGVPDFYTRDITGAQQPIQECPVLLKNRKTF